MGKTKQSRSKPVEMSDSDSLKRRAETNMQNKKKVKIPLSINPAKPQKKTSESEEKDDGRKNAHPISDSESDSSADTQPVTSRKPKTWKHQSPGRQQASLMSPSAWSARDTEAYRNGYPNKKDNMSLNANWKFYNNEIESQPRGTFIDEMHKKWFGDYSLLEEHHGYIQWLFPIREQGMNWQSQELQPHEAKKISGDAKMRERVLRSYNMMLHFWGMCLKDKKTGQIERGDNWKERFRNLNRSSHNYLRITRMLKSLGELGHERLKLPFLKFVLQEAIQEKTLANAQRSCLHYWVHTLRDDKERERIQGGRDEPNFVVSSFADADAKTLYQEGEDRIGTCDDLFIDIFTSRSWDQLGALCNAYKKLYGKTIEEALENEFTGDILFGLKKLVAFARDRAEYFATKLYSSMSGLGTDDEALQRLVISHCEIDMLEIKEAFKNKFRKTLGNMIRDDCSGNYKTVLLALIN